MIIKKIKLENYTVFENQQIEFSPGINVIVGENGTGKTHIIYYIMGRALFIKTNPAVSCYNEMNQTRRWQNEEPKAYSEKGH